jgi:hypothetical protein
MARPRFPRLKRSQSTPTRQVTGTSYVAKGADAVKPPNYSEMGSAAAAILFDPVPALSNPTVGAQTYTKMVRDDSSVRVSLRAGKAPVLGAEWFVEPFSSDPLDLAVAEFVEFNLFSGMTVSWVKVLEQILTMYEAGKSVFEPVWEIREWAPKKTSAAANRKQYTMLRKLAFRPPTTIGQINYDNNGGPVSIDHSAVQSDGTTKDTPIPIEKAVVFTFDQQGGGLEGMPILRSAYKHWFYKDKLYAIDAIQKERHGIGVPDIEVQPSASANDWTLAHSLGKNLRTNEFAYIVRTPNIKVGFAELKGQLVDALASAEHHDIMIMKNIMVQFLNSGVSSQGGGRATSATAMDMMLKSMRHIADSIAGCINMYLVPNMVAYNFPTDRFPKLNVRGVGEVKDMQMWSAMMRNLVDVGAISLDEPTEQYIRAQADMPQFTGEWIPPSERPTKVQELFQGKTGNVVQGDTTNVASSAPVPLTTPAPTPSNGSKSNNGGAGNIGKSPSSGAV